ncbi:MAG: transcriptional regulator [Acidimicrobiales bacterium]|nr:transcriptional regulator [Acidimicrobiales bacterium]
MTFASETETLLLLALRLKSFAPTEAIAEVFGTDLAETETKLAGLAERDLAKFRDGRMSGWSLTPEGRAEGERQLAAELDRSGQRDAVQAVYERFLGLNQGFLELCTRWQVIDADAGVLNDHTDAEYDQAIIDELATTDHEIQAICADLSAALARFSSLGPRFAGALARVQAGELEYLTKPMIDSYHTVWFDLHESLLATLGIDRASEQA